MGPNNREILREAGMWLGGKLKPAWQLEDEKQLEAEKKLDGKSQK